MGESRKLGVLYVFRGDAEALARPEALWSSVTEPAPGLLGEDVFWFGWNEWEIYLPARASMSELRRDGALPANLTYLRIFSEAAEFTWQRDGSGRIIARLCTEIDVGGGLSPQLGNWAIADDGTFECKCSRRILMGTPRSGGDANTRALFEVRYPRPFIYSGIDCDEGKRIQATVYEYLDRATRRLCLIRYRSIQAVEGRFVKPSQEHGRSRLSGENGCLSD